jgi:membrane associated rhomboid family serine protease
MLSDRDYMNPGGGRRATPGDNPNVCVFLLIAINVIVFFTVKPQLDLFGRLALSPMGIKEGMYWQIISSMFLHGGFWHIFSNMWGLYLFGTLVAPHLGTKRFLLMYFISGIVGNLIWLAVNWNSYTVVLGASGALFGVLIATAMIEPNREFILLLFPIPMKTKTLVAVYAVIEVLSLPQQMDNIAHLVHLGGLVGGYLYIVFFCKREVVWDPVQAFISLFYKKKFTGTKNSGSGWTVNTPPLKFNSKSKFDFDSKDSEEPVTQKELDYLLDKVSRYGINSLSESEMATLRKAREQMRRR